MIRLSLEGEEVAFGQASADEYGLTRGNNATITKQLSRTVCSYKYVEAYTSSIS